MLKWIARRHVVKRYGSRHEHAHTQKDIECEKMFMSMPKATANENSVRQFNTFFHVNDVYAKEFIERCNHPFHIFDCVIQWCLWRAIVKPVHMFFIVRIADSSNRFDVESCNDEWNNVFMFYQKQMVTTKNKRDGALALDYARSNNSVQLRWNRKLCLIEVIHLVNRKILKEMRIQGKYSEFIVVDKFLDVKKRIRANSIWQLNFSAISYDHCYYLSAHLKQTNIWNFCASSLVWTIVIRILHKRHIQIWFRKLYF